MDQNRDLSAGERISSGDESKFVFCANGTYVYIYEGSIIDVKNVDAIAYPAKNNLSHNNGIAALVARAAGQAMIDECGQRIKDFGQVRVKDNFVSTAGELPYEGIIHAVGPRWVDYRDQQSRCAKHLYHTMMNVLMEVCSKGWKTVAIPGIGSGYSGVPKQLCAEMYVKALIDFPISRPSSIDEIHFVDKNAEIIELVCSTYQETYKDPTMLVFENAEKYPAPPQKIQKDETVHDTHGATQRTQSRRRTLGLRRSSKSTDSKSSQETKLGGPSNPNPKYSFTVGNLTIYIYKESITKITGMDGIVNSTIATLEHKCGVALQISKAAGDVVVKQCKEYITRTGTLDVTQNFVSSGGNLRCSGIIHAVGPQWRHYKGNRVDCAKDLRQTVIKALESARKKNWRKIAMTAMCSSHSAVPKDLCAAEYINGINEFAESNTGSLVEVHFIDLDEDILDMVINAHKSMI